MLINWNEKTFLIFLWNQQLSELKYQGTNLQFNINNSLLCDSNMRIGTFLGQTQAMVDLLMQFITLNTSAHVIAYLS